MKILRWCAVGALVLVLGAELALRLSGVLDFPLFTPGPPYGYIPSPSQSGAFMRRNDWVFNERSMGTARPFSPSSTLTDTLLVGDSIVSGGNPYRQAQRLGPQLEKRIGGHVWPISANSWSMANELTYIRVNPDVARSVDEIVFVTNSQDFVEPSVWRSQTTHPTHRPVSAIAYIVGKKIPGTWPPPKPAPLAADWAAFARSVKRPVYVVAYPTEAEAKSPELRRTHLLEPLRAVVGRDVKVIDVASDPRWLAAHYRDPIHPDAAATEVLAAIISDNLH